MDRPHSRAMITIMTELHPMCPTSLELFNRIKSHKVSVGSKENLYIHSKAVCFLFSIVAFLFITTETCH